MYLSVLLFMMLDSHRSSSRMRGQSVTGTLVGFFFFSSSEGGLRAACQILWSTRKDKSVKVELCSKLHTHTQYTSHVHIYTVLTHYSHTYIAMYLL